MLVLLLGRLEGAQAQDKRDQRGLLGPQLLQVAGRHHPKLSGRGAGSWRQNFLRSSARAQSKVCPEMQQLDYKVLFNSCSATVPDKQAAV